MQDGRDSSSLGHALLPDEKGQIFAFLLVILFTLFLFVATSINIGQAVIRRVMLQVAADAGAFTGATEMARGMNTIAQQNLRIQRAWAMMSQATLGFTFPPCVASDLATESYAVAQTALAELITALNIGYGRRAAGEARSVTEYNAVDLFPSEELWMGESDSESGLFPARPQNHLVDLEEVPNGTWPAVPSMAPGYTQRSWSCWGGFPPVSSPRFRSFSLWFRAVRARMPIAFVWVVKAPARRARVFDTFFGPEAIPEMTAAAVARPVGGEIALGRLAYVAKMVPLRSIRSAIYDWQMRRFRSIHH